MAEPTTSSTWRGLSGLALVLLALLATAAVRLLSGDAAVSDADLASAARWLRERSKGAVIVVHPPWRDDLVERLRAALPGADVRLAAPVQQGVPAGRLLLVEAGWSPRPAAFAALAVQDAQRTGVLELRRYEAAGGAAPGAGGRSLLLDDMASLRARIELADRTVTCDAYEAAAQKYRCPSLPDWNHVAPTTLIVDGKATRCLWAHPITGGTLRIDLPWPSGVKAVSVWHGLADSAAQAPGGKDVELELRAGERSLARYTQRNQVGWNRHRLALEPVPGVERLELAITTPGDGARHFCVDLRVDDGGEPAAPSRPPLPAGPRPLKPAPPLQGAP